ncbi:MAG: hypothetical protein AAFR55_02860 [Pseudomonadota bacterium]
MTQAVGGCCKREWSAAPFFAVRLALNVDIKRAPQPGVEVGVLEDNPASIRVPEKISFRACDGVIDACAAAARDVPHRVYRQTRAWSAAI